MKDTATSTELGEQPKTDEVTNQVDAIPQPSGDGDQAQSATPQGEQATGENGDQPPEKPLSGFARRTFKINRENEELKARLAVLEQLVANQAPPAKTAPKSVEDFASYAEYDAFVREQERQETIRQAQAVAQQELLQAQLTAQYNARLEQAKRSLNDWDAVANHAAEEGLPQELAQRAPELFSALMESEVGPYAVHAIFKDANLYQKLISLPARQQLRELGKLEERLTAQLKSPPQVKTVTTAPRKAEEPKGATVKTSTTVDRHANKQAWREWRASQGRRS